MVMQNVIHTFSVNEAVEFLKDNAAFGAPMLLDAHTRPSDREQIIQNLGKLSPNTKKLVLETVDDLNGESPEDRYSSQQDFIGFMNDDGLKFLSKAMFVKPRPYARNKVCDYSEPLPIPVKAKDMKEFLYEYGADYIEVIAMPEFNSGTQMMKLLQMLQEDAKGEGSPQAEELLNAVKSLMVERVRYETPEYKAEVTEKLRGLLMAPEDADVRLESVDDVNFSLKLAMAKQTSVGNQHPLATEPPPLTTQSKLKL